MSCIYTLPHRLQSASSDLCDLCHGHRYLAHGVTQRRRLLRALFRTVAAASPTADDKNHLGAHKACLLDACMARRVVTHDYNVKRCMVLHRALSDRTRPATISSQPRRLGDRYVNGPRAPSGMQQPGGHFRRYAISLETPHHGSVFDIRKLSDFGNRDLHAVEHELTLFGTCSTTIRAAMRSVALELFAAACTFLRHSRSLPKIGAATVAEKALLFAQLVIGHLDFFAAMPTWHLL